MLKLHKYSGVQLFGLFILCSALIFAVTNYFFARYLAQVGADTITRDHVQVKLSATSEYLGQYLEDKHANAEYIASQTVVISSVLGGTLTQQELEDQLTGLKPVSTNPKINLYDIVGDGIYSEAQLPEATERYLSQGIQSEALLEKPDFLFFTLKESHYLLITSPIRYNGLPEGLLVYLEPFKPSEFFRHVQDENNWFGIKVSHYPWSMNAPLGWNTTSKVLPQQGIELVYAANPDQFIKSQSTLLRGQLFGLFTSLTFTFAFIYFVGKKFLVSPFQKLEASEKMLEDKTLQLIEKEAESYQLARVARFMRDAIVITDASTSITWVNDAFTKLSGYSIEEAMGRTPGSLLQGPDTSNNTRKALREAIDTCQPFACEILNYHRDQRPYWIEMHINPLFNQETGALEGYMAVERDISERKQLQDSLTQTAIDAQAANVAKSQFLASMSHELRTPMNGVLGVAQLLNKTQLDHEQLNLLDSLLKSGKHMVSVLNDILDYSKIEAGKLELNNVEFSITDVIDKVERTYSQLCADKGLEFKIINQVDTHTSYLADETRISQVIHNLLNNAWKFTNKGSITLQFAMEGTDPSQKLVIIVEDTGIGIAEEKSKTIFDPFTQGDRDTTRRFGGTGLGLSIVAKIVDAMLGDIEVQSEPEKGSRFTITLPVEQIEAQSVDEQDQISQFDGKGQRALVVEDNAINAMLLKSFLQLRGFECDEARNGQIAVDQAASVSYDLIMMDNHMPIMDGTEATKRIKQTEANKDTVIIAFTADAFEENRQKMINAGCVDVMTKPINELKLDTVLSKTLVPSS
ncbi:PAS domain-containing hybrid sensor histidine kinase/response regulator [Aliagarivorans marinus]|uniref:PAS domain-containing hybrid sensor histidine kinase/response regulator n=1 Tax=Aliagarivorans marinus TaxID=561965 RepID=UPI0004129D33|nr:ATP-binding protein [Aliagarivorans marinus]